MLRSNDYEEQFGGMVRPTCAVCGRILGAVTFAGEGGPECCSAECSERAAPVVARFDEKPIEAVKEVAAPAMTGETTMRRAQLPMLVPAWVRFIARNRNGEWWGYQKRPTLGSQNWYTEDAACYLASMPFYAMFPVIDDWKESLIELEVGSEGSNGGSRGSGSRGVRAKTGGSKRGARSSAAKGT